MKARSGIGWLVVAGLAVSGAWAANTDRLDSLPSHSWSPDSQWLAFNWPYRTELFIISPGSGATYLLKPMGSLELDVTAVVASGVPVEPVHPEQVRATKLVPSPGMGRLSVIEWSPDSKQLAYRLDRENRGIFSILEERVTGRRTTKEPLPWPHDDDLQLVTETGRRDGGVRFIIRVEKSDGTTVKEVVFDDLREIRQLSLASYRQPSFLSPDRAFLLYPRLVDSNWQLVMDPLRGEAPPRPLTTPRANPPMQWRLSGDIHDLAVAEKDALIVGALDDWGNARTIPLDSDSIALSWSPDSRYLSYIQNLSLYLLGREDQHPQLLTRNCTQRFWGWRGRRLFFGDARTSSTDLNYVQPPGQMEPKPILKTGPWQSAPREVSVAPDGKKIVCITSEIDGSGRSWWQLWQHLIPQGGSLPISTNNLAGGLVIMSKPVEIPQRELTWDLLYSIPIRP